MRNAMGFYVLMIVSIVSLLPRRSLFAAERSPSGERPDKPNILFILADDLGKEWIGCCGAQDIETPHIDSLADGGMRFTNAYVMPQCTPTRLTFLTGQYPFRHGWTNHWDVPRWGSGCHFDPNRNPSLPRILRQAGYATAAAGKWQIDDFRVEPKAMDEAGFDEWCMWTGGEGGNPQSDVRYWNPYINTRQGSHTYQGAFGPDVFATFLIDFMRRHRDEPMFLYYPMVLTHGPQVPTPDEPEVEERLAKHKADVRYVDKLVGRLVVALDRLDLRKRTIIVFTTDNGTGRGIRGRRNGHEVRGAKAQRNEAGTAMPFIVNGPGRVPAGVVTDALTDITDMFPTFAELAGTDLPTDFVIDGRSIAPLILGKTGDSPREWILAMGGGAASFRNGRVVPEKDYDERVIRDKRYKLWINDRRQPVALYDLLDDPWEQRNVIDSDDPHAVAARKRLVTVIRSLPKRDATPRYDANPPQPWDKARAK